MDTINSVIYYVIIYCNNNNTASIYIINMNIIYLNIFVLLELL